MKTDKRLEPSPELKRKLDAAVYDAVKEAFDIEDFGEIPLSIMREAMLASFAREYYNKGVADAKRLMSLRLEDVSALEL